MEKEGIDKGPAVGQSPERGGMAGHGWDRITDESWRLSHLVQAGRRVSKEQLLEVDREVNSPYGFRK